jgi:SAM-dependent methyltransferase
MSDTTLLDISARTLAHYAARAAEFRDGTRDHDVAQNIAALLRHIQTTPPFAILDFGCGPGRDLRAFAALGHTAIGLDGTARFVEMARAESGCEVWQQDFFSLELPDGRFDGVFANASLFHVPSAELPRVLRQLHATLAVGGPR